MLPRALLAGLLVVGAVCACSPEAVRTRGGGPGADVGNRRDEVVLHMDRLPLHGTPDRSAVR